MKGRSSLVALLTATLALLLPAAGPTDTIREIPLDIPADFAPVFCQGKLYVFSSNGRNQAMGPEDEAPSCDPVQFSPALQPVCASDGPLVLDKEGNLWQLGKGFPKTIAAGLKDVAALVPHGQGFTLVFRDGVQLSDGSVAPLPFKAEKALALDDGSLWVWGKEKAALVDLSTGRPRWSWKPRKGEPGPASLGGEKLFTGSSSGELVALSAADGKVLFSYRGGGALVWPPLFQGDSVICATDDHFVRAIHMKRGDLLWQFRTSGRAAYGPVRTPAGLLLAESAGTRVLLLSPDKGEKVWEWQAPSGNIIVAPAVSDQRLAVVTWGEGPNPTLYLVQIPAKPPQAKKAA